VSAANRPVTASAISILLCVDSYEAGDLNGFLDSLLLPEPLPFQGIVQLINKMDDFFDKHSFPQVFFKKRSFDEKKDNKHTGSKEGTSGMQRESMKIDQGAKGTFLISVHYRQNATWQGTIAWAEKNKKQRFRSALEMIKLIDEALTEADDSVETSVGWESP